jgi:hypothetical protein
MKLLTYSTLAIFCLISIVAKAQIPTTRLINKNVAIPSFSALRIQGPINVTIDASQPYPMAPPLQILGDPKTVAAVNWKLDNHTLYLGTKWNYWPQQGDQLTIKLNVGPAQLKHITFNSDGRLFAKGLSGSLSLTASGNGTITLCTHKLNLKSLDANGKANIIIHNMLSSHLVVQDKSAGKISLEGEAMLDTLDFTGDGYLRIYWINSPYLKITASGKGRVFLAGIAKRLDIQLVQKVQLLAQQLRAEEGLVKTQDQARAEVNIKQLSALAKNNSRIYYSQPVSSLTTYAQNQSLILAHTT